LFVAHHNILVVRCGAESATHNIVRSFNSGDGVRLRLFLFLVVVLTSINELVANIFVTAVILIEDLVQVLNSIDLATKLNPVVTLNLGLQDLDLSDILVALLDKLLEPESISSVLFDTGLDGKLLLQVRCLVERCQIVPETIFVVDVNCIFLGLLGLGLVVLLEESVGRVESTKNIKHVLFVGHSLAIFDSHVKRTGLEFSKCFLQFTKYFIKGRLVGTRLNPDMVIHGNINLTFTNLIKPTKGHNATVVRR